MTDLSASALVSGAQSVISGYWYLLPVVVILCIGVCQGLCVRFCTWSDRRRMRAFTKRSCLQKMRTRLCRGCDGNKAASAVAGIPAASADANTNVADAAVTTSAAAVSGQQPASGELSSLAKAGSEHSVVKASTPLVSSVPPALSVHRPSSMLRLDSSVTAGASAGCVPAANKSPIESPLSATSEAASLTTSSFDETLTPKCMPNYSLTQRRSIDKQRLAIVDDWLQAKRAMGEVSKAEL